jgi:hypothetical protein
MFDTLQFVYHCGAPLVLQGVRRILAWVAAHERALVCADLFVQGRYAPCAKKISIFFGGRAG